MRGLPGPTEPDPRTLAAIAPCRTLGSLEKITDSERRALRSIGTSAYEVATITGGLLAELLVLPGLRIFQGVRSSSGAPPVPHAINSGRVVIFVESVAWPPGRYAVMAGGRIHCDGLYIGQSIRPLITAIRWWRETLPDGHQVSAVVVVHPTGGGELALPQAAGRHLAWTRASSAVRDIRAHLPRRRQTTSLSAVAALIAAITDEKHR